MAKQLVHWLPSNIKGDPPPPPPKKKVVFLFYQTNTTQVLAHPEAQV